MKYKKIVRFILQINILANILFLPACGSFANKQEIEEKDVEINSTQEVNARGESPVYMVESIDNLHLGEEFNINNYFIRNEYQYPNHYYIDSDNILWGYGENQYGQLGNGQQYNRDVDSGFRFEKTPQKIAENVVHVDFGGYFVVFLTENGELYGIGANLNGVMGIDISENYMDDPAKTVVSEPVCLMQDVMYARASSRGITALKKDGSVWWWGEIRTTSAKNVEDTKGVSYAKPEKMLDDAIYVTCGNFCAAAIKENGTLWTWGNNTFGSCGYDSGGKDFIEKPVMVLEDVKMVWMDEARFDSIDERLSYGYISPYKCDYTYVTFAEKRDGSLVACGYEVEGEGSKSWTYMLYGDILRTPDQMNGGVEAEPVTVVYSDVFQKIEFHEKDRKPQLQFEELEFGLSQEEVTKFLSALGINYKIVDGISDEEKVCEIVTEDQYFTFCFDDKRELIAFRYSAYGTRNGKINIGMTREEVENVIEQPCFEETYSENDKYVTVFYQDDAIYEIGYFDGIVYYVEESMMSDEPVDNSSWQKEYKNIICNIEDNLVDPYSLRSGLRPYVYIGAHDFDSDNIPELIVGDGISIAVFTYTEGAVQKIADLYEPKTMSSINGLHYKNNNIILVSAGSDGCCYVCFTCNNGDYIIGTYNEYNPDKAIINEIEVTREEFENSFDLAELLNNSRVAYIPKNSETEVLLEIAGESIPVEELDFNLIMW